MRAVKDRRRKDGSQEMMDDMLKTEASDECVFSDS